MPSEVFLSYLSLLLPPRGLSWKVSFLTELLTHQPSNPQDPPPSHHSVVMLSLLFFLLISSGLFTTAIPVLKTALGP